jgi:prevent-host-death family protein
MDVKIADLKARLSEHLRHVRRGHVLTVLDRATPIAQVVPYSKALDSLRVRHPLGKSHTLQDVPLPRPMRFDIDIVELLMEERQGER